jgi:PEGA domain
MRLIWPMVFCLVLSVALLAQDHPVSAPLAAPTATPTAPTPEIKARVFITDSQSWETRGSAGGSGGNWGAESHGGARPQTAEIIKTFGERCPQVMINNHQNVADYIVLLDHEGGKGYLQHRNKVAVFQALSGDSVMSHSTLSLGNSVKDACEGIDADCAKNGTTIRTAAAKQAAPAVVASVPAPIAPTAVASTPKLAVASTPEGADIEIDGSFVGNTPSSIEVTPGEHQVVVKKSGYKDWTRKLKVSGGDIKLNAELEK